MDLIIRNARLADRRGEEPLDIAVAGGKIVAILRSAMGHHAGDVAQLPAGKIAGVQDHVLLLFRELEDTATKLAVPEATAAVPIYRPLHSRDGLPA